MSCILNIETSTNVCSVSVSENGACIFNQEDHTGPNHNERLGKFVDEALSFAESHAIPLDAVAVSCGPGSYTGLRIGTSMAKGVCYGRGVSLVAIPTLELMCVPVLLQEMVKEENALLCPMIDARRMEVYTAVYNSALDDIVPPHGGLRPALRPLPARGASHPGRRGRRRHLQGVSRRAPRLLLRQRRRQVYGRHRPPQCPLHRRHRAPGQEHVPSG